MSISQQLARALIARESVTPADAGCQDWIAEQLQASGFIRHHFDQGEVLNSLYTRSADGSETTASAPHLLFLGHTDVVPPGPQTSWESPPFEPTERDGYLYGRGAADMKGAVAAMLSAMQAFVLHHPQHTGRLSLLLTSDEEGPAMDGVRAVIPQLQQQQLIPDYCLVGEPSSLETLGDNVRIGRRGSIHARLTVKGIQGHTAYADAADNPAHRALAALHAIATCRFDDGDEHFPATLLHFSNINAGTGAANVTPGELHARFNIRNNPVSPADKIRARIEQLLQQHDCGDYQLDWNVSGEPFITAQGALVDAVEQAVSMVAGQTPVRDTGGGTSDGRFFAAVGAQVVELGLINKTIHQVNESTLLTDLDRLHAMYYEIMRQLLV